MATNALHAEDRQGRLVDVVFLVDTYSVAVLPVFSLLHSNFTFDPMSVDELGVCGEDDEHVDPFSW